MVSDHELRAGHLAADTQRGGGEPNGVLGEAVEEVCAW